MALFLSEKRLLVPAPIATQLWAQVVRVCVVLHCGGEASVYSINFDWRRSICRLKFGVVCLSLEARVYKLCYTLFL